MYRGQFSEGVEVRLSIRSYVPSTHNKENVFFCSLTVSVNFERKDFMGGGWGGTGLLGTGTAVVPSGEKGVKRR